MIRLRMMPVLFLVSYLLFSKQYHCLDVSEIVNVEIQPEVFNLQK